MAWLLIVINGHLRVIAALVHSFQPCPVGLEPFALVRQMQTERWASEIFSTGLWIAPPLVTMLHFINLVLGALSRMAPPINIFDGDLLDLKRPKRLQAVLDHHGVTTSASCQPLARAAIPSVAGVVTG